MTPLFPSLKKIFLLLTFIVSVAITAAAQKSLFSPGYVVVNGDTLRGFVEHEDEIRMSTGVRFKKDQQAEEKTYTVLEASAFGFDDDHIAFEAIPADLRKIHEVKTVTRFAKLLVTGYTNLYKLQVSADERYVMFEHANTYIYIIRKNNNFSTLGIYEFVNFKSTGVDKNYIKVLKYNLFTDCPAALENIDKLEFNDKSMVKAVTAYNSCRQPEVKSIERHYVVKKIIRHGVELGYVTMPIKDKYMTNPTGFTIGYFWDILNPDISKSVSFRLAPNYTYLRSTDAIDKLHPPVKYPIHLIRCPIVVQINFTKVQDAPVRPFFTIGPVLNLALQNDSRLNNAFFGAHLEVGTYIRKCKVSAYVDNPAILELNDGYSVNLTVGYRFDK